MSIEKDRNEKRLNKESKNSSKIKNELESSLRLIRINEEEEEKHQMKQEGKENSVFGLNRQKKNPPQAGLRVKESGRERRVIVSSSRRVDQKIQKRKKKFQKIRKVVPNPALIKKEKNSLQVFGESRKQ